MLRVPIEGSDEANGQLLNSIAHIDPHLLRGFPQIGKSSRRLLRCTRTDV
jgi:hypothetical protein